MGGQRRKATWQQVVAKNDPKAKAIRGEIYSMRKVERENGAAGPSRPTSDRPAKPHSSGGGTMPERGSNQPSSSFRFPKGGDYKHQNKKFKSDQGHAQAHAHAAGSGDRDEYWRIVGDVDRQSAYAVMRVIEGERTKRGANIKTLTLGPKIIAPKATFAVTCQVLKHLPILREVVDAAGLLAQHTKLQPEAAFVLAYEELFGQGLRATGPAERAVKAAVPALKSALATLLKARGAASVEELLPKADAGDDGSARPRTVRVNLLKTTVEAALAALRASGHVSIHVDAHLDDVLVLPPGSDLHAHAMVQSGALVLQSKASCMPARVLQPEPGWHVVDCCAAPGNKTTHVASQMRGQGRIFAFDKDPKRLRLLQENARRAGADKVIHAECVDFLSIDPTDPKYANVRGVILDPSCSGSGTGVSRMDHLLAGVRDSGKRKRPAEEDEDVDEDEEEGGAEEEENADEARVEALAQFQEKAVRHALQFPALERLVYSTCSVHVRENEEVVRRVLDEARARGFALAPALPGWPRRGVSGSVEGAEKVARTDMKLDGTDGFFVALFTRSTGKAAEGEEGGTAVAVKKKDNKKKKKKKASAEGKEE